MKRILALGEWLINWVPEFPVPAFAVILLVGGCFETLKGSLDLYNSQSGVLEALAHWAGGLMSFSLATIYALPIYRYPAKVKLRTIANLLALVAFGLYVWHFATSESLPQTLVVSAVFWGPILVVLLLFLFFAYLDYHSSNRRS